MCINASNSIQIVCTYYFDYLTSLHLNMIKWYVDNDNNGSTCGSCLLWIKSDILVYSLRLQPATMAGGGVSQQSVPCVQGASCSIYKKYILCIPLYYIVLLYFNTIFNYLHLSISVFFRNFLWPFKRWKWQHMASRFIPFHPASSDGGRQDTGALPWCEAAESGMRILPMLSENEKNIQI